MGDYPGPMPPQCSHPGFMSGREKERENQRYGGMSKTQCNISDFGDGEVVPEPRHAAAFEARKSPQKGLQPCGHLDVSSERPVADF